MNVDELKICVGDIVSESDSLYYKTVDGVDLFLDDKKGSH